MKILNFGSLNIDHVYEVPHFLHPGETLSSSKYSRFPGGKGLNQSIAMARAGAIVYHAGKIGENSDFLIDVLKKDKIDTTLLDTTGSQTGHAIIAAENHGAKIVNYELSGICTRFYNCFYILTAFNQNNPLVLLPLFLYDFPDRH